jgi:KDO2-lipid IV(A) lauroyltransferase
MRVNPQLLLPCGSVPAAVLPRRWGEALADRTGDLSWRLSRRARAAVSRNLQLVTGRAARDEEVRGAFRTYARYYLGLMRLAHRAPETALGPFVWDGVGALDRSLERGRGALVLSAHLGNWDLLGIGLAQRYGEICVFVERLRPRPLYDFYVRVRRRHGVRAAPVGSPGRIPVEVLRRNGVLGLVADRPFGARLSSVTCGQGELVLPTGAIRMALRAGSAVHAGFAVRGPEGFRLRIGPDFRPARAAAEEAAVEAVAQQFAAALHDTVEMHPDQWCLLQPALTEPPAARAVAPTMRGAA